MAAMPSAASAATVAPLPPLASAPAVPVVEVAGLHKHFPIKKGLLRRTTGRVYAVDGVSFSIGRGETWVLSASRVVANRQSHVHCCA